MDEILTQIRQRIDAKEREQRELMQQIAEKELKNLAANLTELSQSAISTYANDTIEEIGKAKQMIKERISDTTIDLTEQIASLSQLSEQLENAASRVKQASKLKRWAINGTMIAAIVLILEVALIILIGHYARKLSSLSFVRNVKETKNDVRIIVQTPYSPQVYRNRRGQYIVVFPKQTTQEGDK